MAVDTSPVEKVDAPELKPLDLQSRLAATPGDPKYGTTVKTAAGAELTVGDPRATRAIVLCMNVHAVNGGAACHWGGPAALAEIMSSIHGLMFAADGAWFDSYNFINDAGHTENGIYALRANYGFDGTTLETMRGFRSIDSKFTGHGESHLNPEGVLLSNGPLGSSFPQSQGLAMADKLAGNDRVTFCVLSDGAAMEGEAKEAFSAIPGLASKGQLNPYVLVITDNDTKLSGRITDDAFSMQPTFEAMDALGWNVIKLEHGNDLQEVFTTIEKAVEAAKADPSKPVAVWAKTVKGFGIQSTADDKSGGHGFPLKNGEKAPEWMTELYAGDEAPAELKEWAKELKKMAEDAAAAKAAKGDAPAGPKKDKIQSGFASGSIKAVQAGHPVVSVASDLAGSTGMAKFQKTFPERSFDIGVAESNMVSAAAGLSKLGFIPIVDTFAQFGVTKGKLPLTMAALSQSPVIAVFSHAGFQDAADGASHQATTYIAASSPIPHTLVVIPSCADEADALMQQAIERISEERKAGKDGESVIFFTGRESYPLSVIEGAKYEWGKAQVAREGKDVVLVSCGALFSKAVKAAELLAADSIEATVINNAFVNKPDLDTIAPLVKAASGRVVTMEDHQKVNGMGAQLVSALIDGGTEVKAKIMGIDGEFGQSAYLADELYALHKLTPEQMATNAKALI